MFDNRDLQPLVATEGKSLTLLIPAPSDDFDAQQRFDIERKNVLKTMAESWPEADVERLEADLGALAHDRGEAVFAVYRTGTDTFVEFLPVGVASSWAVTHDRPVLTPLISARQEVVPHVVVVADKAGADIFGFDNGRLVATEEVVGDTEHIHRSGGGGWSHRRFQQRAENTWEENADDVAETTLEMNRIVQGAFTAVMGPVRAQSMVISALEDAGETRIEALEAGDPDGAADEVLRLVADTSAAEIRTLMERLREEQGRGESATSESEVLDELRAGRIDTLLVVEPDADAAPVADRHEAVALALASDADVCVVPETAHLYEGIAGLRRW